MAPRMQFSGDGSGAQSPDAELQRALRASLSCGDWLAQAPPLHLELIAPGTDASAADAAGKTELEVPATFLGAMPLPEFLCESRLMPGEGDQVCFLLETFTITAADTSRGQSPETRR